MARLRRALPPLAALVFAGCGGGTGGSAEAELTVYVSLPLRGASAAEGRDIADGARLALADAGGAVAGHPVSARFLDDTTGDRVRARWSPARAAANARTATEDSTAIAFMGDLESGATRASLPITNEARMLQVSPASGAPDLVAPFVGSDEVPDAQPSGERTFGRVIPSDDVQAETGARWAARLRWRRARIVWDHSDFGRVMSSAFRSEAESLGIELGAAPDARVYIGGGPTSLPSLHPGDVLRLIAEHPRGVMGSDAFLPPFGRAEAGLYTSAALDPADLPPAGRRFADRFRAEYGRAPGRYAAYGYEAMSLVLDSIERADEPADRAAVIDAFFETENRDSVLGTYSIDELGETTLDRLSGYETEAGRAEPVATLRAP